MFTCQSGLVNSRKNTSYISTNYVDSHLYKTSMYQYNFQISYMEIGIVQAQCGIVDNCMMCYDIEFSICSEKFTKSDYDI